MSELSAARVLPRRIYTSACVPRCRRGPLARSRIDVRIERVFATADHHGSQTFTGTYDWSDADIGPLKVDLEPVGEGTWKARFDFNWQGQDRTWTGTVKGSLADGTEVTGTATDGNRNWVFEASIEDEVMSGTHREIREGRDPYESGTFEIER